MWIKKESAFDAIVPSEAFYTVQGMIRARTHRYTNEELIEKLRALYQSRGLLPGMIIDETEGSQALQQTQRHQERRSCPADGLVGRQQANGSGCHTHDQHRDQEGFFAADHIAQAAEKDGTERAQDKASAKGGQRGKNGRALVSN